jgi:RNA polymerase sigma factor (sigma-70 family)
MLFDERELEQAQVAGWLVAARRGDRAAFAQLVQTHQSRIRLQLRRLAGGDAALADDLAQDTFVQAWLHLAEFRGEARFSTWLHRIAVTRFLQHARRPRLPEAWCDPEADDAADPGHDPRPAEGLARDVERALRALTEAQRLAVVHCFHLDLSHAEAAQVLGLPLGTLKSHLERAKARLREQLGAWNPESVS